MNMSITSPPGVCGCVPGADRFTVRGPGKGHLLLLVTGFPIDNLLATRSR